jgi:hypothetical protein
MILALPEKGNNNFGENMTQFINTLIIIVTLGAFSLVNAQSTSVLLRLTLNTTGSPNQIEGYPEAITEKSIILTIKGHHRPIPRNQVKAVEIVCGRKKNIGKGVLIGTAVGGIGLGLLAAREASDKQGKLLVPPPEEAFASGFLIGGLLGAGAGAIIGAGTYSHRWKEIPLEELDSLLAPPPEHPLQPEPRPSRPVAGEKPPAGDAATLESGSSPESIQRKPGRRFQISFLIGWSIGGPGKDIESAMRRDGWDETEPIWPLSFGYVSEPERWQEHPYSENGFGNIGFPWALQISYAINQRFDGALLVSHAPIGMTYGYRSAPENHLTLNYYQTTASVMVILKMPGVLQIGLGPALMFTKIEQEEMYREKKTRLGVLVQLTAQYPKQTRFFVNLNFQYRWMPKATFGPFKDTYHGNSLAQLNPFEANFSHTFLGFGFGIRL